MSRTVLTFTQRELLADWLRENYVQLDITDPQALELARQALHDKIPDLNYRHVKYLRIALGIPVKAARVNKPKPGATAGVEGRKYIVDYEIDIPHIYRRLVELENRVQAAEKRLYEMGAA